MAHSDKLEIADESEQQATALALMNALHEAGFTKLWLDSVRMFSGGLSEGPGVRQVQHYQLAIIVDEQEIHASEMRTLHALAEEYSADVSLVDVRMNQQQFSRIRLWIRKKGES